MSIQVRIRRDTLSNLNTVIPADGEMAYNTTDDRLHMGDGATSGGIPHANYKDIIKNYFGHASAVGGTGNAITITLPYAALSYSAGMRLTFKAGANNSGATTVNVSGLGVKNIYITTAGVLGACVGGEIINGNIYTLIYDGTQFQLDGYIPTVTAPGMVLLAAAAPSGAATTVFSGLISAAYFAYDIFYDATIATDNRDFWLRTSTNGGASYDSGVADYGYSSVGGRISVTSLGAWGSQASDDEDTKILLNSNNITIGNAAGEGIQGRITLLNPMNAASRRFMRTDAQWKDVGTAQYVSTGWASRNANADIDSLQFLASSGNHSGVFKMYGWKA